MFCLKHVVPNTFASVTVIATFAMAIVIISEASLSFLGLGVPASISDLGLHVERGEELYEPRSMADDLSRAGDLHYGFRHQSAGRRAARYIGSEAAETSLAHKSSSKRSNGSNRSKV